MTTPAAAKLYEAQHVYKHEGKGWAIYNPHNTPIQSLPVIYGFNNGGTLGMLSAVLLAEDGEGMGSHACSSEGYMPYDLGILEGTRPDRHEGFRQHYPEGYRMEFVSHDAVENHHGLLGAFILNTELSERRSKEADG